MIGLQRIEVAGQRFVLLPEREYDRLCSRAGEAIPFEPIGKPPSERGTVPVCSATIAAMVPAQKGTVPGGFRNLPPLPKPNKDGSFPAVEYARISLARDIIRDRRAAGLTQQQLADLVGARQETISRIETGKHTASAKLVDKIDRALRKALAKRKRPG
jgi:DNA-binding XRE family transcriptional regulator